ncbi:hypothetical protein JCM31271_05990 [Halorubrum trueperi]
MSTVLGVVVAVAVAVAKLRAGGQYGRAGDRLHGFEIVSLHSLEIVNPVEIGTRHDRAIQPEFAKAYWWNDLVKTNL